MITTSATTRKRKPARPRIRKKWQRGLYRAHNFTTASHFRASQDALSIVDGTGVGSPELRVGASGPHLFTPGGTQGYVNLGTLKSFTNGFTALVHFRVDGKESALTNTDRLFASSGVGTIFYLACNNLSGDAGALNYRHSGLSVGNTQFSTPTRFWTDLRPHTVMCVYDLATVSLYADGIFLGSQAVTGTFDLSSVTISLSQNGAGDRFGGEFLHVDMWERPFGRGDAIEIGKKPERLWRKKPVFSFPPAAAGNIVTGAQTEAGDTQVASVEVIVKVDGNQAEAGDTQVATVSPIVQVTGNQTEAGDTQVATVSPIVEINANQTEAGDTQVANVVTEALRTVTANQLEAGDVQLGVVNVIVKVTAAQVEAGDVAVASVRTQTAVVIPTANGVTVNGQFGEGVATSGGFGDGCSVTSSFGQGVKVDGNL